MTYVQNIVKLSISEDVARRLQQREAGEQACGKSPADPGRGS